MRPTSTTHNIDYQLLGLTIALTVFGLIMLSSASSYLGHTRFHDTYYFTKQQLLHALVGITALWIIARMPAALWKKMAFPLFAVSLFLLLLVFIPGIGVTINSARSWLTLGPLSFQPAEFAKLTFILYLAVWLEKRRDTVKEITYGFLPFLALLGLLGGLIVLQPDVGTVFIIAAVAVGMFYIAGGRLTHLLALGLIGAILIAALVAIAPYRKERIKVFLNPASDASGVGYHVNQAMIAIGSGGWWGLGLGKSRQKFSYLPEVAGDSIFAVMGEELGFVITALFFLLLGFFVYRLIDVAAQAPDHFSTYAVMGVTFWIAVQSLVNIGAMLGLLPLTGLPLPFVSYGGTALLTTLAAVGVVLSISKEYYRRPS